MVMYTLSVEITPNYMKEMIDKDWNLCCAVGMNSDYNEELIYSIIALAKMTLNHVTFTFEDQYAMAVLDRWFKIGVPLGALANSPRDIALGQTYTYWENGNVKIANDRQAPREGFRFLNQSRRAAAVVYQKIDGELIPIYTSQQGPRSLYLENLIPTQTITLWFANTAATTMITSFGLGEPFQINMADNSSHETKVLFDGQWTVVSNP